MKDKVISNTFNYYVIKDQDAIKAVRAEWDKLTNFLKSCKKLDSPSHQAFIAHAKGCFYYEFLGFGGADLNTDPKFWELDTYKGEVYYKPTVDNFLYKEFNSMVKVFDNAPVIKLLTKNNVNNDIVCGAFDIGNAILLHLHTDYTASDICQKIDLDDVMMYYLIAEVKKLF